MLPVSADFVQVDNKPTVTMVVCFFNSNDIYNKWISEEYKNSELKF